MKVRDRKIQIERGQTIFVTGLMSGGASPIVLKRITRSKVGTVYESEGGILGSRTPRAIEDSTYESHIADLSFDQAKQLAVELMELCDEEAKR